MLFVLCSVIVFNAVALMVPKRLSLLEMWVTSLFALMLAVMADVSLDLKLGLYEYFGKGVQWETYLVTFGLYPSASIVYLNCFPNFRPALQQILYIVGWSLFCILFEMLSLRVGYFQYHGWKLWYSALLYPLLLAILQLHLQIIRRWIARDVK